jgi:8-oxo-dGTP diphosphatase
MPLSRQALCYMFRSGKAGQLQVLLGRKKRGFGAGMIMGLGGKAGPGESDAACAAARRARRPGSRSIRAAWPGGRSSGSSSFPPGAGRGGHRVRRRMLGRRATGVGGDGSGVVRRRLAAAGQMLDDEAYWLPRVLAGETLAGTITHDESGKLVARAQLRTAAAPRGPAPGEVSLGRPHAGDRPRAGMAGSSCPGGRRDPCR